MGKSSEKLTATKPDEKPVSLLSAAMQSRSPYKKNYRHKISESAIDLPDPHTYLPQTSVEGVTREDFSRVMAGAQERLLSYKRKSSVHFEEVPQISLKREEGVISKVWVDPEVLEDPLYVDYTVSRTKQRVIHDGQIQTVHEITVKRKHDIYDQYDRGLLVVPKPSTLRLKAFLSPFKSAKKVKTAVDFLRRAKSEKRMFIKKTDTSVLIEEKDTALPKIHQSNTSRHERSEINLHSKEVRSSHHLSHIKSKVLENVITRVRLRKPTPEKLSYGSYKGAKLEKRSFRENLLGIYEIN
mmetsp:Transcript_7627/g.14388  ORF Transcript_7627/g.14388 Transcript_7627/m.14388 type:complete len:297 (-) Transcript_7627:11-901(-)